MGETPGDEAESIRHAIAGLESQRALLGDAVVDPAIAALRQKLDAYAVVAKPPVPVEPLGERKLVTIMFADITGFTALSELLDPEDVRNLINACFDELVPIVERHGGVVDKFMGDAIMALFGARVANEDDPQRALAAALDMLEAIQIIAQRRDVPIGLHFGINTGQVVTGNVGSSHRSDYSVVGDAVNLAARLEDLSEVGEILVGPTTRRQALAQFDFEERPPVLLKGKRDPVPIFRLLSRRRGAGRVRLGAPLTGRSAELEQILAAVRHIETDKSGTICIIGEAGLGKTRLVAEACQRSAENVRWLMVSPRGHGHASGFSAIRALLLQLLEFEADPDLERLSGALTDIVQRCWDSGRREARAHLASMLALGEHEGHDPLLDGIPSELLHARFAHTVEKLLGYSTAKRPTVVVWEDLHWADQSSLQLVTSLLATKKPAGCLHLATSRPEPEVMSSLEMIAGAAFLNLEPIGPEASRDMLKALLAADDLDEEFAKHLLDRAEGNPFFLEELIQSLIDSDALVLADGKVSAGPTLRQTRLPPTLQGVMMARLDRLTAFEKKVVQTASVLGRAFERSSLDRMLDQPGELDDALRKLEIIDIIRPDSNTGGNEGAFKFKHAVTQEVAYKSLLRATRRRFHELAADAIRADSTCDADRAALLAFHYENSDHSEKAAPFLLESARLARESHAVGDALRFYDRIVALGEPRLAAAGHVPDLIEAHAGRGELLQLNGRPAEAIEAFECARSLLAPTEIVRRAGLLRRCGLTEMGRRNAGSALSRFNEADETLGTSIDPSQESEWRDEWIEIQLERLWALGWAGQFREAARITGELAEPIALYGDIGQRARYELQQFIGLVLREDSQVTNETVALGRNALALAKEQRDPRALMIARLWFGYGLFWHAAWEESERNLVEALRVARFIGDIEYEVLALITLTSLWRLRNDPAEAAAICLVALETAQRADMQIYAAVVLANQAWIALRDGRPSEAASLAEEAASIWRRLPYRVKWLAHWPLLSLAIDESNWQGATEHALVMLSREQYRLPAPMSAALESGLTYFECGNLDSAAASFREARRLAQPLGMV